MFKEVPSAAATAEDPTQQFFDADPYKVLGVGRSASPEEIRSKYRKLQREYHPDTHPGDNKAAEISKELSIAYKSITSGSFEQGAEAEKAGQLEKLHDQLRQLDLGNGPQNVREAEKLSVDIKRIDAIIQIEDELKQPRNQDDIPMESFSGKLGEAIKNRRQIQSDIEKAMTRLKGIEGNKSFFGKIKDQTAQQEALAQLRALDGTLEKAQVEVEQAVEELIKAKDKISFEFMALINSSGGLRAAKQRLEESFQRENGFAEEYKRKKDDIQKQIEELS